MSIVTDPLCLRSREPGLEILSYLGIKDLSQCCKVSKFWKELASLDYFWNKYFPDVITPEGVTKKAHMHKVLKDYNDQITAAGPNIHFAKSAIEVMQCMKKLTNKVPSNQKISFSCIFPFASRNRFHYSIQAQFGYGEFFLSDNVPSSKVICIFTKTIPDNDRFFHRNEKRSWVGYELKGGLSSASCKVTLPSEEFATEMPSNNFLHYNLLPRLVTFARDNAPHYRRMMTYLIIACIAVNVLALAAGVSLAKYHLHAKGYS